MTSPARTSPWRTWLKLAGALMVSGSLGILGIYLHERWTLHANQFVVTFGTLPPEYFLKFEMPGIDEPPTVEAARSKLPADEKVIGVVVEGRARAYRLVALRDRSRHIVNDVVGETPISVTYCDLDDCVRGFVGQPGEGPLGVSLAGLYEGHEMILEFGGTRYFQNSGREFKPRSNPLTIPLEKIEPTLTSWGAWKRDHPETDVYEGRR